MYQLIIKLNYSGKSYRRSHNYSVLSRILFTLTYTFSRVPSLPKGLSCFEYISGAVYERFFDETETWITVNHYLHVQYYKYIEKHYFHFKKLIVQKVPCFVFQKSAT